MIYLTSVYIEIQNKQVNSINIKISQYQIKLLNNLPPQHSAACTWNQINLYTIDYTVGIIYMKLAAVIIFFRPERAQQFVSSQSVQRARIHREYVCTEKLFVCTVTVCWPWLNFPIVKAFPTRKIGGKWTSVVYLYKRDYICMRASWKNMRNKYIDSHRGA